MNPRTLPTTHRILGPIVCVTFVWLPCLLALLTLMACPSPAAEHSASPVLQQSYAQLLSAGYFAFGEIRSTWGGPYEISNGEQSLRTLAGSTNGLPLLKAALTNGTTAAKLYALCGIRHLAPEEFDALAEPLLHTDAPVGVAVGWIMMAMPTSKIVAQIKRGSYEDFLPPAQSRR